MTRRRQPRQTTKPTTLQTMPTPAERAERQRAVARIANQLEKAALARGLWVSGDGRIYPQDVKALTGLDVRTIANHRGDPAWPQPATLRPTTYTLASLAARIYDTSPAAKEKNFTEAHGHARTHTPSHRHKGSDG